MIPFRKYHGLGNDFIILKKEDAVTKHLPSFVKAICQRHTGIGADGCILVSEDPLEMEFYNQDGSRASMCGNGIRCFVMYCYDEHICRKKTYDVTCWKHFYHVERRSIDPFLVRIEMGKPLFDAKAMHMEKAAYRLPFPFLAKDGTLLEVYPVFMTTMHAVIFLRRLVSQHICQWGKEICEHPMFHQQTNVDFVVIESADTLRMQTYEKGAGMTLACGSGACAAAVIAHRFRHCNTTMDVLLPKGILKIEITEPCVYMEGEASCVAKGEYNDE